MRFLKTLKLNKYFLGFVFLFAYAQAIQGRILVRQTVNFYTFTPEGAISTFIESCVIFIIIANLLKWFQKNDKLSLISVIKVFVLSLLGYLLTANTFSAVIALVFNTWDRNFTHNVLLNNNIGNVLDVCIYGGFYIAYFFYQKNRDDAKQLLIYNQALADSKIAQLKAQLNPHFLFNNLNAIDQLIDENPIKASDFLNSFADLYRYALETSNKKLVPIEEEIAFVQSYFKLMQYKFDAAYQLNINQKHNVDGFIVPLTLQLLVENAIQHNLGTVSNPIVIDIDIDEMVSVTNRINLKKHQKVTGGRAINNLKEQYLLLSSKEVEVKQTEQSFAVTLPIIIHKQND